MSHIARTIAPAIVLMVTLAAPAGAQVVDDLQCYQIKDTLNLAGIVAVTSPQFGPQPGCKVSRAKLFCIPASTSVVSVVNKKTQQSITPLPFTPAPQPGDQVCYKIKCPKPSTPISDQTVTDQFGTRTISKFDASYLCVSAVKGTTYCGDGTIAAGEDCEPGDLGGATCTSLGFASGTLACAPGCTFDFGACVPNPPGTCGNGTIESPESCDGASLGGATCVSLGFASGSLACTAGCGYDVSGCVGAVPCAGGFPATGQTTCWDSSGALIPCAGAGQDGEIQAGATLSYTDNGDGTITDNNTGLMWEKLAADGSIHDKDTTYTWENAFAVKIAALNTPSCFAGHCDWRLPNGKELHSIVNWHNDNPAMSAAFNTACAPGCTVTMCSCANPSVYWTASTYTNNPVYAWVVSFDFGGVVADSKPFPNYVRAVRGGL